VGKFNSNGVLAIQDSRTMAQNVGGGIQFLGSFSGTSKTIFAGIRSKKDDNIASNYGAHLELLTRKHGGGDVAVGLTVNSDQSVSLAGNISIPSGSEYQIDGTALGKGDIGLGNVNNVASYSTTDADSLLDTKQATNAYLTNVILAQRTQAQLEKLDATSSVQTQMDSKQEKLDGSHLHLHSGGSLVGIGTSSPDSGSTLTIHGVGKYKSNGVLAIQDSRTMASDVGGGIQFRGSYSGTSKTVFAGIRSKKDNATAGHYGAHLELSTRGAVSGDVSVGLTVDSSQNVSITNNLDVNGNLNLKYSNLTDVILGLNSGDIYRDSNNFLKIVP
jgi:hypothetical protein